MSANSNHFDTILVGGGLQSGLIAAALRHADPTHSILLIERDGHLGGNHTWSFHLSDVDEAFLPAIEPLIETRWASYSVRVGRTRRTLGLPYASLSSSHFDRTTRAIVGDAPTGSEVATGSAAVHVDARSVRMDDGRTWTGDVVIDSRGPDSQSRAGFHGGYQKFWGFEYELDADWPDTNPIVMDDSVDQSDGFRFFYVLPFSRRRVLVEDTRFSNTTDLDRDECRRRVESYMGQRGVTPGRIIREEHGVLPMPIDHHHRPTVDRDSSLAIRGGYAGGWFHAATGYSFPMAAAFAQTVASDARSSDRDARLRERLRALADQHSFQASFGRFLNRLLFELVRPKSRVQIFQRFYRVLSEDQITRFYSHRFRTSDAARIVIGMPPTGLRPIHFARSFGQRPTTQTGPVPMPSSPPLREVSA